MKELKDIPIQDEILANKATYLAIQNKNQNLGGVNNSAFLIPPTQLQIASFNFNLQIGDMMRIMLTETLANIDSCSFVLYNNVYDEVKKMFVPFEPVLYLTQQMKLNQTNNVMELVNFEGNFSIVKDFSSKPIGVIGLYGSNNSDVINNIMNQGIKNKWSNV